MLLFLLNYLILVILSCEVIFSHPKFLKVKIAFVSPQGTRTLAVLYAMIQFLPGRSVACVYKLFTCEVHELQAQAPDFPPLSCPS